MRVLFLTDRLSDRGGADWHLLGVISELTAAGLDARLAVGRIDAGMSPPCPVQVVPGLEASTRQPVALEGLLAEIRPDLLHLQNVMNPEALEWVAHRGVPALATVQDHRVFCPGRGKWRTDGDVCREPMSRARCRDCFDDACYFERVFTLTEERMAVIRDLPCVVLSRYMASELISVGVPDTRIRRIPPFVHGLTVPAPLPDGHPCVLFAGRLVAAKGVQDAVNIWRRAGTSLRLVIAGAGPERAKLPTVDGLEFAGWVPRSGLSRLLARSSALLLPSRWQEPFGIVGVEAMAVGVPVVAWRSGGVNDWHPGPLCEWGDIEAMAAGLCESATLRVGPVPGLEVEALTAELLACYKEIAGSVI